MSTESPVQQSPIEAPMLAGKSDIAARNAALFANAEGAPQEPPDGTDLAQVEIEKMHKGPKKETPKVKDESGIPDEILGIESKKEPEEDLLNTEPKGQLKNENYKKLQAHAKELVEKEKAARAAIEKEYQDYKGKFKEDALPEKYAKEHEATKTKLKEYEDIIGRKYVEESQDFRERFTSKQASLTEQLKKAGEELGLDSPQSLLNMSFKKRMEVLRNSELDPIAAGHITSLLQQHDQVEADKASYLTDWQGKRTEMERSHAAQEDARKATMKEHLDKAFDKTLEDMSKKFAPLKRVEGNDQYNAELDKDIARAKTFMEGNFSDEQYAEIVLAGVGAIRQNAMFEKVLGLYREAKAELASLKIANPDVNGASTKVTGNEGFTNDRFTRNDAHRAFRNAVGATRENEVA